MTDLRLLVQVEKHLDEYNHASKGGAYNRATQRVYKARQSFAEPFSPGYATHIVEGLKAFDMGRRMSDGGRGRELRDFQYILGGKLEELREWLLQTVGIPLTTIDIAHHRRGLTMAYEVLAVDGDDGLDARGAHFHVGATKVLHWLCPDLFIMVDRKTAGLYRDVFGIAYRKTTQPGYTAEKYLQVLQRVQDEILTYGPERLQEHEPDTPLPRIADKVAWVRGR